MKFTTKQLTLCALLTAMALGLSYLENFFPLSLAIPVPGIKLGLANIITVFAVFAIGPKDAAAVLFVRVLGREGEALMAEDRLYLPLSRPAR